MHWVRHVVLTAVTLLAVPSAALAGTLHVDDPDDDGLKGRTLDITSLQIGNRDHAIIIQVSFVRVAFGDLAVYIQARGDRRRDLAVVISRHRARQDADQLITVDGTQRCRGLSVRWDHRR